MATLAELQADLEALRARRRTGAQRINAETREVAFRSDAELAAAIASIEEQIKGSVPRNVIVRATKGW